MRAEHDVVIYGDGIAGACPVWTKDTDFFGTGIATYRLRCEANIQGAGPNASYGS
jgi:PIN domain